MKAFEHLSLRVQDGVLSLLDQTLLPHEEKWISCAELNVMIDAIKTLKVRGAPLIGVSAALFLQLKKEQGASNEELNEMAKRLVAARPTAVNLAQDVERFLSGKDAWSILKEDQEMCEAMARFGAELVPAEARLLTHCNTGALATAGAGTALAVIAEAQRQGKRPFVWVDETRPLLQGGRLTAWELLRLGVEHKIICDNMAATLMKEGQVDAIFVGSDRICRNGDFANKIGTYSLAVLAKHHGVPFYVVAPESTLDLELESGKDIEIEFRGDEEVKGFSSEWGEVQWGPKDSSCYNPAFDVTPHELVTKWVLNTGAFTQQELLFELNKS